jgi:hypothetical protein
LAPAPTVDGVGGSSVRGSASRTGRSYLVARAVGTRAEIGWLKSLPGMAGRRGQIVSVVAECSNEARTAVLVGGEDRKS